MKRTLSVLCRTAKREIQVIFGTQINLKLSKHEKKAYLSIKDNTFYNSKNISVRNTALDQRWVNGISNQCRHPEKSHLLATIALSLTGWAPPTWEKTEVANGHLDFLALLVLYSSFLLQPQTPFQTRIPSQRSCVCNGSVTPPCRLLKTHPPDTAHLPGPSGPAAASSFGPGLTTCPPFHSSLTTIPNRSSVFPPVSDAAII